MPRISWRGLSKFDWERTPESLPFESRRVLEDDDYIKDGEGEFAQDFNAPQNPWTCAFYSICVSAVVGCALGSAAVELVRD